MYRHASSFLSFPSFFLSPASPCYLPNAGDLEQLHLPVGMKNLTLKGCKGLTGKAQPKEWRSEGEIPEY